MPTFRELRKTATRLKIKDRSKMNKAQLEKAITRVVKSSKATKSRKSRVKRSRKSIVRSRKLGNKTLKKKTSRKSPSSRKKSRSFSRTAKRKQYINYKFRMDEIDPEYFDTMKTIMFILGNVDYDNIFMRPGEVEPFKITLEIFQNASSKGLDYWGIGYALLSYIPQLYIKYDSEGRRNVWIELNKLKRKYGWLAEENLMPGETLREGERLIGPDSNKEYWTCHAENDVKSRFLKKIIEKCERKLKPSEDKNKLVKKLSKIRYVCHHGPTSVSPEH